MSEQPKMGGSVEYRIMLTRMRDQVALSAYLEMLKVDFFKDEAEFNVAAAAEASFQIAEAFVQTRERLYGPRPEPTGE